MRMKGRNVATQDRDLALLLFDRPEEEGDWYFGRARGKRNEIEPTIKPKARIVPKYIANVYKAMKAKPGKRFYLSRHFNDGVMLREFIFNARHLQSLAQRRHKWKPEKPLETRPKQPGRKVMPSCSSVPRSVETIIRHESRQKKDPPSDQGPGIVEASLTVQNVIDLLLMKNTTRRTYAQTMGVDVAVLAEQSSQLQKRKKLAGRIIHHSLELPFIDVMNMAIKEVRAVTKTHPLALAGFCYFLTRSQWYLDEDGVFMLKD